MGHGTMAMVGAPGGGHGRGHSPTLGCGIQLTPGAQKQPMTKPSLAFTKRSKIFMRGECLSRRVLHTCPQMILTVSEKCRVLRIDLSHWYGPIEKVLFLK